MKENNEKKIKNEDEISKVQKNKEEKKNREKEDRKRDKLEEI